MQLRTFRNSGKPELRSHLWHCGEFMGKIARSFYQTFWKHPSLTFSSCDLRTYQTPNLWDEICTPNRKWPNPGAKPLCPFQTQNINCALHEFLICLESSCPPSCPNIFPAQRTMSWSGRCRFAHALKSSAWAPPIECPAVINWRREEDQQTIPHLQFGLHLSLMRDLREFSSLSKHSILKKNKNIYF